MSEQMRKRFGQVFLFLYFTMAPSTVPDWRADPGLRTVAVLPVGEPTPALIDRRRRPIRPTHTL